MALISVITLAVILAFSHRSTELDLYPLDKLSNLSVRPMQYHSDDAYSHAYPQAMVDI
jgi:hypothetical protein